MSPHLHSINIHLLTLLSFGDGRVWVLLLVMAGLIVAFWFIAHGVALQYLVLFIGVMSCMYSIWDIIDDLILRKGKSTPCSLHNGTESDQS